MNVSNVMYNYCMHDNSAVILLKVIDTEQIRTLGNDFMELP